MHRALQKVWGGVGWVCKPILVLSFGQDLSWAGNLGQAEQLNLQLQQLLAGLVLLNGKGFGK